MIELFNIHDIFLEASFCAFICITLILVFLPQIEKNKNFWFFFFCLLIVIAIYLQFNVSFVETLSFSNLFINDSLSWHVKLSILIGFLLIAVYSRNFLQSSDVNGYLEFYVLSLFLGLGAFIMVSSNHYLSMYLGLELLSLSTCVIVALSNNKNLNIEASVKFFVLSALSSGFLLFGISLLYGATGTLFFNELSEIINSGNYNKFLLSFALVFLVSAIAFKIGVIPFHMWLPDVYQGSSYTSLTLISSVPKIAGFTLIYRILDAGFFQSYQYNDYQQFFSILAILSVVFGNLIAIAQVNLKRMIAFSTIAHMGFLLFSFIGNSPELGQPVAFLYVVVYFFSNILLFGLILRVSSFNDQVSSIYDLKGLNRRNPLYAFLILFIMLSLAGIPPTIGFWAKLSVINLLVNSGFVYFALIAVIFSVIGAFYYLRIIKIVYFDDGDFKYQIETDKFFDVVVTINGFVLLSLGFAPGLIINMIKNIFV